MIRCTARCAQHDCSRHPQAEDIEIDEDVEPDRADDFSDVCQAWTPNGGE